MEFEQRIVLLLRSRLFIYNSSTYMIFKVITWWINEKRLYSNEVVKQLIFVVYLKGKYTNQGKNFVTWVKKIQWLRIIARKNTEELNQSLYIVALKKERKFVSYSLLRVYFARSYIVTQQATAWFSISSLAKRKNP